MSLLINRHVQSYVAAEGTGIQKASGNMKQLLPLFHPHARPPCDAGVNISQMQTGVAEAEFQRLTVIRQQEDIRDGLQAFLSWQINANFRTSLSADLLSLQSAASQTRTNARHTVTNNITQLSWRYDDN